MADYINGREFFEEMKVYHSLYLSSLAEETEKPLITNKIANAILQICNRLSNLHNFCNYTYKQEMISDACLQCLEKVHRFDPTVSENPFAFFTQIAWQCFIARIKKEQHQSSVKARLIRDKMSSDFVQHGVDADADDGSNAFVEFLKEHDSYIDYNELRAKKEIHPSLKHKNKTAYTKKTVELLPDESFDLTAFEDMDNV